MKNKMIPGLLLAVSMWCVTANAAQSAITCDRECLRGKVTQLLYAFLKHDVSKLPVADTLRVTEDAVEKPLAKVGLAGTVTRLRGFRQDILDERAGVVGADVVVEESSAPLLLVVRLKVVAGRKLLRTRRVVHHFAWCAKTVDVEDKSFCRAARGHKFDLGQLVPDDLQPHHQ